MNAAAVLFVLISSCALPRRAEPAVRVEGAAAWLTESAERSMGAVYEHIPALEAAKVRNELLRVVADRLLLGYSVESVSSGKDGAVIKLRLTEAAPKWGVSINPPALSPPADGWFASDIGGMADGVLGLLKDTPAEALSWGDIDLKKAVDKLSAEKIPGWKIALMARNALDGRIMLDISFTPEQPLTLAVNTNINSSSIPAVLHSSLKNDLVRGLAPVIGVPAAWLGRHADGFALLCGKILAEEKLVRLSKAEPVITVAAGVVSDVDVELESRRYAGRLWMAVYAGARDRYPEAGIHLGRRIQLLPHWDMELYGELTVQMDDLELEGRLGLRWPAWRDVWVGGERSGADGAWWGGLDFESWSRHPYARLRYSENSDINAALGYHINEHISVELSYDSRYEDEWNARAMLNL